MTVFALTTTTATVLSKVGNGEYSAASVSADPTDATKLGLVKEKDGNYGTANPNAVVATGSAAAQSSSAVQASLTALTRGGA
ncbi:hypothetical protein [Beijerinckia sp. L45]|uniref:hypothetical protein n=1 Tax=Beijerinckia sp. L45 TaxID=1641855 RepID=UPI00131BE5E9|nr:hypothetical protein [Beijerinckia sp. L45]